MKPFLTFCALCCFVGIFRLPIEYYTFLRTVVSVGAVSILYNTLSSKQLYFSIIFFIILIFFNPIFPIYLYRKNLWIPIDVITGILFLLVTFIEKIEQKKEEEIPEEASEQVTYQKSHSRDRIVNLRKSKEE